MKNIPEKIWLQVNPVHEDVKDFNELHGITWHKEKVFFTDIEYTRSVNTDEDMVEFAEWAQINGWEYFKLYSGWKHFKVAHQDGVYKSTSDLLKLFREEKEKQKQLNQK